MWAKFLILVLVGQALSVPLTEDAAKKEDSAPQPRVSYSRDTIVKPGEDATLDCAVEGLDLSHVENFRIDWSKIDEEDPVQSLPITSGKVLVYSPEKKYELIHPEGTHQYSLKVNSVQAQDTGLYRCLVYFAEDQFVTPKVYLSIEEAPSFSDDFIKQITVEEGDSVTFQCTPRGTPEPITTWQKVQPGPTLYGGQFHESNTLEIPSVSLSDQGRYVCHADNKVGVASSTVVLTVEYAPHVKIVSPVLGADIDEEYKIECRVQSYPEAEVAWYMGDEEILGDVNYAIDEERKKILTKEGRSDEIIETVSPTVVMSSLTVKKVTLDSLGQYSCSASNSVGTKKAKTEISFKTPPEIVQQGSRRVFYHDEKSIARSDLPTAIECLASGVPTPEYKWLKNDKPFTWQANPRFSLDSSSGSLLVENPEFSDNGWYQCIAFNSLGVAKSDVMYFYNASTIEFDNENTPPSVELTAELGRPFEMKCPNVTADPSPKIVWVIAGQPKEGKTEMQYFSSNRTVVGPDGTAYFTYVTAEDDSEVSGKVYMCMASNDAFPTDLSIGVTVTLKVVKPKDGVDNGGSDTMGIQPFLMYGSEKEITVSAGQANKLWCIFGGEPEPAILWTDKNGIIVDGDNFMLENHNATLVIKNTNKTHEGNYKCTSSNEVGGLTTHDMNMLVQIPPTFRENLKKKVVEEGQSVTLECAVEGDGDISYQWYVNGRDITNLNNARRNIVKNKIIINPVLGLDTGNYACNATSSLGYTYGQTTLLVLPSTKLTPPLTGQEFCPEVLQLKQELVVVKTNLQKLTDFVQNTRTAQADASIVLIQRIAGKLDLLSQEEKDLIAAQDQFKREQQDFKVRSMNRKDMVTQPISFDGMKLLQRQSKKPMRA